LSKHERSESKGSAISKSKHSQAIEARRPGIVHRLDKDTSGLLIVAKTEAAHRSLSKQLAARKIHRTYLAVVEGLVPRDEGTINAPIGRHLTHRKEFTVRAGGREAVTHYRVIKRASSTDLGLRTSPAPPRGGADLGRFSVLEVQLETGRTHQIRVHLAHIGHPVLGDAVYGRRCLSSVSRQLLHAKALALTHPVTGKALAFEAVLPADFQPFLD
ncbi:MAG: RluA family pseudouridine synthase, partial [Candidatus Omnitrophica bacterium]|nr:RluA family pseudouridine synthase [Candidatus Omnitrophota bacterium]